MKTNFCFEKDINKIENYEKAKLDNFKGWIIHHRLESHFSDGTQRPKDAYISSTELIALNMYYFRPPEELIFLTTHDHINLHFKDKKLSNDHKEKVSASLKEYYSSHNSGMKSKHQSNEAKEKDRIAHLGKKPNLGKKFSDEHKRKISNSVSIANKGCHWYNNDTINKYCKECPSGFKPGKIKKRISEEKE